MRPCPKCGTPAPEEAARCLACGCVLKATHGQTLPAVPAISARPAPANPAPPAATLAQTLQGFAPPTADEAGPPITPRLTGPAALKATVMGMGARPSNPPGANPSTPAVPLVAQPTPKTAPFKGTMMGIAPAMPSAAQSLATTQPLARPAIPAANPLRGTMIGMAPPTTTPVAGGFAPPAQAEASAGPPPGNLVSGRKTMMGIAIPGIAPLNPGVEKAVPAPPPPPAEPPTAQPWRPAALPELGPAGAGPTLPTAPSAAVRHPLRIPAGAALAIVGAAALLTAAIVALLLYRSRGAVEATLGTSADGHDQLSLTCSGCQDGSSVHIGSGSATFRGGRAQVPLAQKLAVGDNVVAAELERRPGRSDKIELKVPVDFRIRADTSGLTQAPPRIIVRVEAVPHAAVVVDGQPLALTPSPGGTETGSAEVDISRALTGASSVVGMLERKVPYSVTPPSGSPAHGEVSVRIGITPLVVQAPGPSIVIDTATFVLAGHTAKDATVTVEGRPITVDGSGAFAQMMSVSSLGETSISVRADAKEQAPRLVPVRVRRVQNLTTEAASARASASATTSYSAIERDPDGQRGLAVALDGNVVEARVDAFTTVLLLDVKSGCSHAPCLARVSIGEKAPLKEGSLVSVFGAVTGAVEGPHQGTRIPAISADFVVKGQK